MSLLFGRIKNWIKNETVKASDVNAEFNNLLNNASLPNLSGYSANTAQMQIQADPGSQGSESLALTAADEITRIRFVLSRIVGGTFWYDTPATSLDNVLTLLGSVSPPPNRIVSGKTRIGSNQPAFLSCDGSDLTLTLSAAATPFVYYIGGTQYSITNDTLINVTAAPTSATAAVNDTTLSGQASSQTIGEGTTTLGYDSATSNFIAAATVGTFQAFGLTHAPNDEYFIAFVLSSSSLGKAYRGYFFDSAQAPVVRVPVLDDATLTYLKINWIFATTGGALDTTQNNPHVSFQTPQSPSSGDYWLDLTTQTWKKYNGSNFAAANATLIGMAITNGTACIGVRSFDFYAAYDSLNTAVLEIQDNNTVRTAASGAVVNVAGNVYRFTPDLIRWVKPTNFESGTSDANNATYYLYLKDTGDVVISSVIPYDRFADLRGYYHPYQPWRCLGNVTNDGSSHFSTILPNNISPQIADTIGQAMTSTGANSIWVARSQLQQTNATIGNLAVNVGSTSGIFSMSGTTDTAVTNLAVTLAVSGKRAVKLELISDGDLTLGHQSQLIATYSGGTANTNGFIVKFYGGVAGTTLISQQIVTTGDNTTAGTYTIGLPPSAIWCYDSPSTASVQAYSVKVAGIFANTTVQVLYTKIVAREI